MRLNTFIEKSNKIHNNKFDYSKFEYTNVKIKSTIICSEHGEFEQTPESHLNSKFACPGCLSIHRTESQMRDITYFLEKAHKVHGDKYDYSKFEYKGSEYKGIIICPDHGEFRQKTGNHLHGQGCYECGLISSVDSRKITREEFIQRCIETHGDKYDYSKFDFTIMENKGIIICPEHGEFIQSAKKHSTGQHCPECSIIKVADFHRKTLEEFIRDAVEIHGDKYDYSKFEYINSHAKSIIICPDHGEFEQMPYSHLDDKGCPDCGFLKMNTNFISKGELEVCEFLDDLEIEYTQTNRNLIYRRELDIYIPDYKMAIEFNGIYWHSELHKDRNYHFDKKMLCLEEGIHLFNIWEDDWNDRRDIVKGLIKSQLGFDKLIDVESCDISKIDIIEFKNFLDSNDVKRFIESDEYYGIYYNNDLVSIFSISDELITLYVNKLGIKIKNVLNYIERKYKIDNIRFELDSDDVRNYEIKRKNKPIIRTYIDEHNVYDSGSIVCEIK